MRLLPVATIAVRLSTRAIPRTVSLNVLTVVTWASSSRYEKRRVVGAADGLSVDVGKRVDGDVLGTAVPPSTTRIALLL